MRVSNCPPAGLSIAGRKKGVTMMKSGLDTTGIGDDLVRVVCGDGVAFVEIHNPPLNILTKAVKASIRSVFDALQSLPDVRAIVLSGHGPRAFCAGADLREFPERIKNRSAHRVSREGHALAQSIATFPGPTIAAIHGMAFGGGCEIALCCDIRIASDEARLGFPEIHRGVFPGNGGTQRLPQIVGHARAMELLLVGEPITALEAHRIGLVNQVTTSEMLADVARGLALELASRPAVAVECIKALVHSAHEVSLEDGLEKEAALFGLVFETEDVEEGVAAFFEKRKPSFESRRKLNALSAKS